MSGFDTYAHEGAEQKCPKCHKRTLYFDKVLKAWSCVACRYRDRA